MATIAVLAAQLQLDGSDEFSAKLDKANQKLEDSTRHFKKATDSASTFDKQGVKVAMRGTDAFAGKLAVLNKTAAYTPKALDTATKSAGSFKGAMAGATQAARGFGSAVGGLGSLSPVLSSLASPAGIAAAAIGGMALAVKKLQEANDNLDLETLASTFEKLDKAAAAKQAGGSALLKGIIDGASPAALEAIVKQAQAMAELAVDEAAARKTTEDLLVKQKALLADIEREQNLLSAVPNDRANRDKRQAMTEIIEQWKVQAERLQVQMDQTWGALVPAAKDLTIIKSETDKILEADEKRAKAAERILTADEKLARVRKIISRMQDSGMVSQLGGEQVTPKPDVQKIIERIADSGMLGKLGGEVDTTAAAKAEKARAKAKADAIEAAARRRAFLESSAQGMFGGLAGSALQGGLSGGPAGIGIALLSASKGFQDTMAEVNKILQTFADVIGETLRPVVPLLQQFAELLRPLTGALGAIAPLVTELNPAFMILSIATRALADTVERTVRVFTQMVLGVLKAINKALHKMHISWNPLDNAIDSLKKTLKGLDKTSQELAETFGTILPEGYKLLELRRYQSSPGIATYVGPGGVGSGGGLMAGGGYAGSAGSGITVQGNIELHGIQDVPSLARALAGERRWRNTVHSGRAVYALERS